MQVTVQLRVSSSRFFEVVQASILEVINQGSNTRLTKASMRKGFKYKQTLRNGKEAQCVIAEYQLNQALRIEYHMENMFSEMGYLVQALDETHCEVTFINRNCDPETKEEIQIDQVSRFFGLRNMKKRLHKIEKMASQAKTKD